MAKHYKVSAEDLLDIYERIDDETARDMIRTILYDGERVNWDDLESLYPDTYETMGPPIDVDASELVRELNDVETAEKARDWVHERHGSGQAHLVNYEGEEVPYVSSIVGDEIPDGWEYAESSPHPYGGEIVKK